MIVALVSEKGGVGKTTSAVNLGAALAARRKRVLLVDLDPQAGASRSLGVPRHALAPSSADVLLRGVPFEEVERPTSTPGLSLVTSSVDLHSVEEDLSQARRKELLLARAIAPARGRYDAILLDCPPSLTLLARNAVAAADGYLVPAVPHFLAVEGLQQLLGAVERLSYRCAVQSSLLGIVLTMVDYRVAVARANVASLRARFGDRVCAQEVRVNIRLAEAPAAGKTIFQFAPDSAGAQAYRALAAELLSRAARPGVEDPTALAHSVG